MLNFEGKRDKDQRTMIKDQTHWSLSASTESAALLLARNGEEQDGEDSKEGDDRLHDDGGRVAE